MAIGSGTAARAPAFVAGYRVAVLILLAPKLYLFLLRTLDASLTHLLVVLYLGLRELAVFPEDDVETKAENAESHQGECSQKHLHQLMKLELISS